MCPLLTGRPIFYPYFAAFDVGDASRDDALSRAVQNPAKANIAESP